MELSGSASGKRKRSGPRRSLEYPCVSRLCYRRLFAFLWRRRGFDSTFQALASETRLFFRVAHLQRLARLGQWGDAIKYLFRFVQSVDLLGYEGKVLFGFLEVHKALDSISTGHPHGTAEARFRDYQVKKHPNLDPGIVKGLRRLASREA